MTQVVNWNSDPLLFPKTSDHPTTLNDLLAAEGNKIDENIQLLSCPLRNFFGVLIHQNDFSMNKNQ